MTGLSFVGHGNATLNNTIDAIEQSNSKLNSTTYGHMYGKTYYYDSNFFNLLF